MSITFYDIYQVLVKMNNFGRKWRFTEEKYDRRTEQHLLKILDI